MCNEAVRVRSPSRFPRGRSSRALLVLLSALLVLTVLPTVTSVPDKSKQMSIRSFFKPSAAVSTGEDDSAPAAKRARLIEPSADAGPTSPAGSRSQQETPDKGVSLVVGAGSSPEATSSSLTPEQLERIAKNKALAQERLAKKEQEGKGATVATADDAVALPGAETTVSVMDAVQAMPKKWKEKLQSEFDKPYFKKLCEFHAKEVLAKKKIFPPTAQIFSAFYACDFDKISVVIVGQDPYHGPRQAHGLCFSVQKGVATPPSLVNIYKELQQDPDIPFNIPKHGCLTKWAEQGVLLLNACLSVENGKANSHKEQGWEKFTDAVIATCNKHHDNLVFLLWGAPAAKKCASVDMKKHTVLKAPHPSPLSAHRGFFGCRHFSKCNAQLKKAGRAEIDWQID